MLANLTIGNSNVSSLAAVVLPMSPGCDRDERGAATDGYRPFCSELTGRCLASGCPIAAFVKAAGDAHKSGLSRRSEEDQCVSGHAPSGRVNPNRGGNR